MTLSFYLIKGQVSLTGWNTYLHCAPGSCTNHAYISIQLLYSKVVLSVVLDVLLEAQSYVAGKDLTGLCMSQGLERDHGGVYQMRWL